MIVGTNGMMPALYEAGMFSASILAGSWALSWAKTSAPRTETPVTAPISRLVLAADAAMPDRSGGTAPSTAVVIGTTVIPMPIPASASPSDSAV